MMGMTPVAVHDGRKPLDDLVALHTACDVDEFHRRLVLYPPGPTNRSDAFEPWCLFQHFHKDTPEGAVVTAALLVTDRRWRNASGHLMRRIDESGLVPPGDLDILAQTFLAAGPQVYWEVPGEWFDGPAIIIDLGPGSFVDDPDDDDPEDEGAEDTSGDGPALVARKVRPPLRRWAAGRLVRADPAMWGPLMNRARESDPRGGAGIVRGVLDGIDGLTPAARGAVVKVATGWPQRAVREAALATIARSENDSTSPPIAPAARSTSPRDPAQPSLF